MPHAPRSHATPTVGSGAFLIAVAIFFLSGFAALAYQVIWQRLLIIFSGADVYSVTLIVTAYMGGLGLGSFGGGRVADRLGAHRSLMAFAVVEVLIGAFGFASKSLYYDWLYELLPNVVATPATAAVVLFLSLLWPTLLMGMSLPLLARALTLRLADVGRVVGSLYGWNTLGAATGAFMSTWVLLPRFGMERSLWIAAAINLICAAATALLVSAGRVKQETAAREHVRDDVASVPDTPLIETFPFRAWVLIYAVTGFIALGLEIVWFRFLSVMMKSTAFTFGTLLTVYLAGFGLGAAVGARRVHRGAHPGTTFLLLQLGVILYTGLAMAGLLTAIGAGRPSWLAAYLAGYEPVDVYGTVAGVAALLTTDAAVQSLWQFVALYFLIPAALIGPPTFLMGFSVPYLQQASHADVRRLGRRVGTLLASNIAGSMAGAALTGWALLAMLGTAGTLKLLVFIGGLLIIPTAYLRRAHTAGAAVRTAIVAGSLVGITLLVLPQGDLLWARLHGASPRHIIQREDGAGVSVLKYDGGRSTGVFVNGLGQSWIPFGGVHTALGALPVILHPDPADVLIIGLGSGDTVFAAGGRSAVQRLTCVEIIGAQLQTLQRLARTQHDPGLVALLSDSRIAHEVGDGRAFMRRSGRLFDVIEADALRPTSAYSGNLYSREYFALLAKHLKPGGLAVTWAPTERVQKTFLSVFPHVLGLNEIWVGSNTVIPFDRATVQRRLTEVAAYYERANLDIMTELRPYLQSRVRVFGPDDPRDTDSLNTDVFPRDEFQLPGLTR